ncbi:hypothetical protein MUO79_01820 [Candidatus Bathyarchaeota archaeon]|nr:hypothetical protein [Candidatus Bathyarchaeota archaeon]
MPFNEQVLQIMNSQFWKKTTSQISPLTYNVLRRIIIEQLGFTDKRTIEKWIGHEKTSWKRHHGSLISAPHNEKVNEWVKGLLEQFWIIKKLDDDEAKAEMRDFYVKEHTPYFKILKDKVDFQHKNTT